MIDDIHYLHGIKLASGTFISELTDLSPQNNQVIMQGVSAGHPFPMFRAIAGAKPDCQFVSPQCKTIIDALGLLGLDVSSANTDFLFRRGDNCGARQANTGGDHKRLRGASGFMYMTEINADYQNPTTIRVRYKPISADGATAPWVPAGSLSITDLPAATEYFTLGKVYINSTLVQGIKGVRIAFNHVMREEGAADDIYDTYCGVDSMSPVITLRGLTWAAWSSYGLTGASFGNGVEIYLRKKAADGIHVATATTQHIKISSGYGLAVATGSQTGDNNATEHGIDLHTRVNSGDPEAAALSQYPLVFNTASASL